MPPAQRGADAQQEAELAQRLGHPPYSFSDEEVYELPSSIEEGDYVQIRNHSARPRPRPMRVQLAAARLSTRLNARRGAVLFKWHRDVTTVLSETSACCEILERLKPTAKAAYRFLHRHGCINFGLLSAPRPEGAKLRGTVVVVGAGLAGLAAARQLEAFGLRCVLLEARCRPGGRVHTTRLRGGGADGVAELGGSVLTGIDANPLAPLVRQLGARLHTIRDVCPLYGVDGTPVPADIDERVTAQHNALLDACGAFRQSIGGAADLVSLGRALDQLARDGVGGAAANGPAERALLDWHKANLEYANAGLLTSLSLGQWDQDDPWEMGGDHCLLPGGNHRLVHALADGLPIFYGCCVERIAHGRDGVVVTYRHSPPDAPADGTPERRTLRADACLITVPLGVLKAGDLDFAPPLPARKRAAIRALGFGTLNKCVMLFQSPFWEAETLDTFGHVAASEDERGLFFLFYGYARGLAGPAGAVLVGLVAGKAAMAFEALPPAEARQRCMAVLRGIYGPKGVTVPEPLDCRCTAWNSDPYSRGSYSHVPVGASGEDYLALAAPVGRRLFFAGEATTRTHPATMHGALFTGLREAARISTALSAPGVLHHARALRAARAAATAAAAAAAAGPVAVGPPGEEAAAELEPDDSDEDAKPPHEAIDCGALAAQLASLHVAGWDWDFGAFSLLLPPGEAAEDAPAVLRLELAGGRGRGAPSIPLYLGLRAGDARALRDCPGGDAERMRLLHSLSGCDPLSKSRAPDAGMAALVALRYRMLMRQQREAARAMISQRAGAASAAAGAVAPAPAGEPA